MESGSPPSFFLHSHRDPVTMVSVIWLFLFFSYSVTSYANYAEKGRSCVEIVLDNDSYSNEDIASLNGLASVRSLDQAIVFSSIDANSTPVLVMGKNLQYPWVSPTLSVIAGTYPKRHGEAMTSEQWAAEHAKRIGDNLAYADRTYRIVGIADVSAYHTSKHNSTIPYLVLVIDYDEAISLFNRLPAGNQDLWFRSYVHLFVQKSSTPAIKGDVETMFDNRSPSVWAWQPSLHPSRDLEEALKAAICIAIVPTIGVIGITHAWDGTSLRGGVACIIASSVLAVASGMIINLIVGRDVYLLLPFLEVGVPFW